MGRFGDELSACALKGYPPQPKLQVESVENHSQFALEKIVTLVIPPGFAEVAIEIRNTGDPVPWFVTYGIDVSAAGGDVEEIGGSCMASFANWTPQMSTDTTITGVNLTIGQDGPDPVRQFVAAPVTYTGAATGGKLPQNCALLVRKNTGAGGRRSRGRYFMPAVVAEGAVDNVGLISGDALGVYQGLATEHLEAQASEDVPMVLLHGTGSSAIIDPTPVVSLSCDNVISTQRRRLR